MLATILGYIFGFLGGWLGLAFSIYLVTREHPKAKYHGKIILVLTVIMIINYMTIAFT
jgi:bacteriorhodopsin